MIMSTEASLAGRTIILSDLARDFHDKHFSAFLSIRNERHLSLKLT